MHARRFLRTSAARGKVVYVGDEARDVAAARKAGVDAAAVTWGYQARQLLHDRAPVYLADSPEELAAWLCGPRGSGTPPEGREGIP